VPAYFILSLDCEGKWGAADRLTKGHRRDLSDLNLRRVYGAVIELLDEYQISATFAFAGGFTQSSTQLARLRPQLEELGVLAPNFLKPALRDIDETGGNGWHGNTLVEAVKSARMEHEIALHGVTHVPWTWMDRRFAETEMRMFEALEGPIREAKTFVYPRNLIAHTNVIAEHGFEGFRAAGPRRSRAMSLLSEFNIFEKPAPLARTSGIIRIPTGLYLNWRHGLRGLVPPALTRLRAKRLLRLAEAADGVVHYWLHPENIVTGPATLDSLRMIVRDVANARDDGRCKILTQLDYCHASRSGGGMTCTA
jgi:peptidoglycan/xylan/chitin deacetylase (PgdA/CDA1 family)